MTPTGARRLAVGALVLAGCGAKNAGAGEGGGLSGPLSFDVTATYAGGMPTCDPSAIPLAPSTFSLTLDPERFTIIAGESAVATTNHGGTFRTTAPITIGSVLQGCSSLAALSFDWLEITVAGGSLRGTMAGTAHFVSGTTQFLPFTADLTGVPDTTAPFLEPRGGTSALDPFGALTVHASEPLPSGVKATLVGPDGSSFDMIPNVMDGPVPIISWFDKPDVVLMPGAAYSVTPAGLVDFAGNPGQSDESLRLGAVAAAPLAPEDGFESLTSARFGGAGVVRSGDLAPISGAQSLYIGGQGTPGHEVYMQGPALFVRLAMQPGDQKLRFTFRTVSLLGARAFEGTVRVGSAGAKPSDGIVTFQAPPDPTTSIWASGGQVTVGGDQTLELALPPGAHDEVVVGISTEAPGSPASASIGLVIDDLRLE